MTQGAAHFDLTEAKAPSVTRPSRCLSNSGPVVLHVLHIFVLHLILLQEAFRILRID